MKIVEAIQAMQNIVEYWTTRPTEREAAEMALTALREKAERENPAPLTVEEMWQMDGEPVFVVYANKKGELLKHWNILSVDKSYLEDRFDEDLQDVLHDLSSALFAGYEGSGLMFSDYGKTWTAYRNKPKEAE